ncbi:MAG: hypothetical protein FWB71_00370 [Defluviitaleaceae bacterium]|nr:hypothetical protein [Defluviitaleaceae bacterium]
MNNTLVVYYESKLGAAIKKIARKIAQKVITKCEAPINQPGFDPYQ